MTTLEDIRNHMINSLASEEFEESDYEYDEDGHCSESLLYEIKSFWENFKTDDDFIYLVTGEWINDIDLDGGRSYLLSGSKVTPLLFDYLYNTLNWSLEKYQSEIYNSTSLTEDIEELYDSLPVKRDLKIDKILHNSKKSKPVNIWQSLNFDKPIESKLKVSKISDSLIEEVYSEIKELDKTDPCSISEAVCKFTEESGEWIREINKTTGRKILKESIEEVHSNIKEEAADTLQNLLLICSRFDITIEDLLNEVKTKNKKWQSQIPQRQSLRNSL